MAKPRSSASGAAIACGHEVTAAAACEVLEEGGNAFDAAIAAACAACVVEPVLSSLAGGGYLLAGRAGASPVVYDFFVDTPSTCHSCDEIELYPIDADFGTVTQEFHIGMGSVATPGIPAGLSAVHRDLGSLPMSRLVSPALGAAREGVAVNARSTSLPRARGRSTAAIASPCRATASASGNLNSPTHWSASPPRAPSCSTAVISANGSSRPALQGEGSSLGKTCSAIV
jgi:gamma-glutamyltranspeptidase